MKIEVLKEFIKKTVQQEVRNVIHSEIKLQLAEIFSKILFSLFNEDLTVPFMT